MDDDSTRSGDDIADDADVWARYATCGGPLWAELCRERFAQMMARPDAGIDLAGAALLIAQEEYPDLAPAHYLAQLDNMAAAVRRRIEVNSRNRKPDAPYIATVLSRYLFEEMGLRGNRTDMTDPRNSFLNDVLERRTGLPIMLSLIYMEVARRIGFAIEGVGLPGHFIVRHPAPSIATNANVTGFNALILNRLGYRLPDAAPADPDAADPELLIDPFNNGVILSHDDVRRVLRETYGQPVQLRPEFLASVTKKQIMTRMLGNLKISYVRAATGASKEDTLALFRKALAVSERLVLLNPEAKGEYRDRGLLYLRLGSPGLAAADLAHYLRVAPDTDDSHAVRRQLQAIRTTHISPN